MANYPSLDRAFHALSNPTRRAILAELSQGEASISALARPFDMAFPSFVKHVRLLEQAGWIHTEKSGRVRTCRLEPRQLEHVAAWLNDQRATWLGRTDRLEQHVLAALKDPS